LEAESAEIAAESGRAAKILNETGLEGVAQANGEGEGGESVIDAAEQSAAREEDANQLTERGAVIIHVHEDSGAEDFVEGGIGEWKTPGVGLKDRVRAVSLGKAGKHAV